MRLIVALAGKKGSGKSTIAHSLEAYGFSNTSFGRVVRAEASMRSLDMDTATLENVGRALIREWGWSKFCSEVLQTVESSHNIVVDGIRHVAALEALRALAPSAKLVLVFVEISEAERLDRLSKRSGEVRPRLASEYDGMTEEMEDLRSTADVVVDGGGRDSVDRIREIEESP